MYNANHHLAKWSIFIRCVMHSLACTTPFPPRPKVPFTCVVYVYRDMSLSKGHLGFREESIKSLKNTDFIFPMTSVTVLSVFRTHAQKEYRKILEMKSTSILNILALLLLEN